MIKDIRIGLGHDIHAFASGRALILGGVKIPHEKGLAGHSDADALLHAIMDALLGALALGDIGKLFPDTDTTYKDISSLLLLSRVLEKVKDLRYIVGNVDTIIHCEKPKISPYREAMKISIAEALCIDPGRVSIKAGTNEGFDSIGRGEALACQAIILLMKAEE